MKATMINKENIDIFEDFLPEDMAENIGRLPFRALALTDNDYNPEAAVIWKYNDFGDLTKDCTSSICWISDAEPEIGEELFDNYTSKLEDVQAIKSSAEFTLPEAEKIKNILTEAGFSYTEKENGNIVVNISKLSKLAIVKKKKVPRYIKPFGTLMQRPYRRGIMNCIFHTSRKLLEDLSSLSMDWFDPDMSCYVETDEKITGFLLVHKLPSGKLRVEFMSAFGPDAQMDMIYMMRHAILQAESDFEGETEVILPRRDESSRKLIEYFFPNEKGKPSLYFERKEN